MTLRQFAELVGVSSDIVVTRWETGKREPDLAMLQHISDCTGRPLSDLLGGAPPAADTRMIERIGALLETRGRSRRWLAGQLGVTEQAVSNWFRQGNGPSLDRVPAIAAALETSTDYLHGIIDDPAPRGIPPAALADHVADGDRLARMEAKLDRILELVSGSSAAAALSGDASAPASATTPAAALAEDLFLRAHESQAPNSNG